MEVIPFWPSKSLVERIGNRFPGPEISQFTEEFKSTTESAGSKLDPADSVADVWPESPNPNIYTLLWSFLLVSVVCVGSARFH